MKIIYTDLDGTLLDHETYSFAESLSALRAAQAHRIPVVFCSSKTRAEIEVLRRQMRVSDPFIIENGGAVVIPARYFPFFTGGETRGGDATITLGTPYQTLVENMRELQREFPGLIVGFNDMTEKEIADDCGLTLDEARWAKRREFDEPFLLLRDDAETITRLMLAIGDRGLYCSQGGRYYHLHGHNDKGRAVRLLNHFFRQAQTYIFTVGLGDSLNDLPMLALADYPVLVRKPDGRYDDLVIKLLPQVHRADGIGPRGWQLAVTGILNGDVGALRKVNYAGGRVAAR